MDRDLQQGKILDQYGNATDTDPEQTEKIKFYDANGVLVEETTLDQIKKEEEVAEPVEKKTESTENKDQPKEELPEKKEEKPADEKPATPNDEQKDKGPVVPPVVKDIRTPEQIREDIKRQIKEHSRNIAFVDVGRVADAEARDVAEERITEEREKTGGLRNIFKRVWKHNIAREYYRQKEITKAKEEIYGDKNIYAGEEKDIAHHQKAMSAITERFVSEYEGVIREDSGEKKRLLEGTDERTKEAVSKLKNDVKGVITDYAEGKLDDKTFEEARTRILSNVTGLGKGVVEEGKLYADNLKEIASQVKQALSHGVGLNELDLDFNLSVGRAVSGVRTEANYNSVDKIIKKVYSTRLGAVLANETTFAAGIAIASSFVKGKARATAAVLGLVGGLAVSAGISGAKENMRLKMERAQHIRQTAKGKEAADKDNSPRRERMDDFLYETKSAQNLTKNLFAEVYVDGDPTKPLRGKDNLPKTLALIAEIEGRINLSNKQKIDLISFSNVRNVEAERSQLEIELARAKARLKTENLLDEANKTLLGKKIGAYEKSLLEGDIHDKDRQFRKMKSGAVAAAAAKGALTGGVFGLGIQEMTSFFSGRTEGVLEHAIKGNDVGATHATPLERLREWLTGKGGLPGGVGSTEAIPIGDTKFDIDGGHFRFSEGVTVTENTDGTIAITAPGGAVLAENLDFEVGPGGAPTPETLEELRKINLVPAGEETVTVETTTEGELPPKDYVNGREDVQEIKRDLHFDNDTKRFDRNELRTDWGGVKNTGIDENGNYVFNISRMTSDGSFHGGISTDAKDLTGKGELRILLSLSGDTQDEVFPITITASGDAVVPPDSEVAKIFFSEKNGHAVFEGKYAEVAETIGTTSDGVEQVRILSTVVGDGVESVPGSIPTTTQEVIRSFELRETTSGSILRPIDLPPVIPFVGRRPLEPMKDGETKKDIKKIEKREIPIPPADVIKEKNPDAEVVELKIDDSEDAIEPAKAPEQGPKGSEFIDSEEYDALKQDLEFINKKIQGHEGIIAVEETDLKSGLAKKRYGDLEHIPEGKNIRFNYEELRAIGDDLEKTLVKSKVAKTTEDLLAMMLAKGVTKAQFDSIKADMEAIVTWNHDGRHLFTFEEEKFKTSYAKLIMKELKAKGRRPELYQVREKFDAVLTKVKVNPN